VRRRCIGDENERRRLEAGGWRWEAGGREEVGDGYQSGTRQEVEEGAGRAVRVTLWKAAWYRLV
jgi:hypothetical protein